MSLALTSVKLHLSSTVLKHFTNAGILYVIAITHAVTIAPIIIIYAVMKIFTK